MTLNAGVRLGPYEIQSPIVAVSRSGSLIYATGASAASTLVWVSWQGVQEPVTDVRRPYFIPRVALDGRRIVVQASGDLWIQDTMRATFARLTSQATFGSSFPVWTPDGKRVVFRTNAGLYWADADGSGRSQAIPGTSLTDFPTSIAPDGDTLLIARQTVKPSQDVCAKSGQMQVYIRPFPAPDRKWHVSTEGGTAPVWNRSGRGLLYRTGNKMMAVDIMTGGDVTLSAPRLLFEQTYAFGPTDHDRELRRPPGRSAVSDGQRRAKRAGSNVVLNWLAEGEGWIALTVTPERCPRIEELL
jgi:hypothetical protein